MLDFIGLLLILEKINMFERKWMPFDTTLKQLCVILRLNRKHTDIYCVRIGCIEFISWERFRI